MILFVQFSNTVNRGMNLFWQEDQVHWPDVDSNGEVVVGKVDGVDIVEEVDLAKELAKDCSVTEVTTTGCDDGDDKAGEEAGDVWRGCCCCCCKIKSRLI